MIDHIEPKHHLCRIDERLQIAGSKRSVESQPRDMGVRDDKGRLMVAVTFNSDVGDAWEFADLPSYPERFSALGIRLGVNYIIYSMTH